MNKKRKVGTMLLTTGLLGVSAQAITSNLAGAASIKEVLGDSTTTKKSKPSLFWQGVKGLGKGIAAAIGGAYTGSVLAAATCVGKNYLTGKMGDDEYERNVFFWMCSVGLGVGILMNLIFSGTKSPIKNISRDELEELKLKIESVANKKTRLNSEQSIYIETGDNHLKIGIKTDDDPMSSFYGPLLKIDISTNKPEVTFQENGVNSKKEEIKSYEDLSQKLGNMLHKVNRTWVYLDQRKEQKLSDIKITGEVNTFVYGHPLQKILSFLETHKDIMRGTTAPSCTNEGSVKLISYRDGEESKSNLPIISYELHTDEYGYQFGWRSERESINLIDSFLASKNLKDDYRLKLREDNAGNYKLSLYKGEPSEDTYVGDIEDEEDVKILKDLEVPEAKKYIVYGEKTDIANLLRAYMEKYPENKKMRDVVYLKFYVDEKKLFLDETSHRDSDDKPENRLYFVNDDGNREYVFEPEDIKDNKDAQKIKKTIINIIKMKYEK